MAKKYYDGDITLNTEWGGDASTENLPVIGSKVQKVIKEGINSKVGYVGRVEKVGQGFYVLTRDEETFNAYLNTITDENPFGDLTMDGVNGRFDAPFNYKMNITLINPESGYKSTMVGSTGNVIKFRAETLDNNNTPQGESMTITFKIKTEGGVETSYTAIYDGNTASLGIEYNLDGKLGAGVNTVTISAVGMNTGISAMRRITYRLIDMYLIDKFDIAKRYQFKDNGTMAINVGYDLKGVGKTKLLWYFDGNHYDTEEISNTNPILYNTSRNFYFTEEANSWLTPGVHNIQISMICKDSDSGEEFQTPIYYREFIVEKTPTVLTTPYIVRKVTFDNEKGFLKNGENPTISNAKQFENIEIEFAAYYNGKSTCHVTTLVKYSESETTEVFSEELPLVLDDFSNIQKQTINLTKDGSAEIILRAIYDNNSYYETSTGLVVSPSDMNITTVEDNVVLYLNAFGRSNNTAGKDKWEYKYLDNFGNEQIVETVFSKNEYTLISTLDLNNEIVKPEDANESNSLIVNELPNKENELYKYLIYNNEYYIWSREFDWSDTSGWSDNKLKLANGNAITINYKPFAEENIEAMKAQGATFEFEFETTNVYNDDAVICRICGNDNFAPGIVIYASGAELVISREIVTGDGENAGYNKKVSTKYKAEESNRISFVITPDSNEEGYRNRILSIYVNGELCGAYAYDKGTNFSNDSNITFRGSEDACVNIYSIKMYKRALSSNEILSNYIYYRNNADEKTKIYRRNDIMLDSNDETFDSDKLKSQLPVMMIYQIDAENSLDDIHQEKKNKKLTRFFDVVYIDIQNPSKNFLVKNAYVTPQGTSSMNYPVKNLRLYTGKKDDAKNYYSRLFVGSNIFKDGSPSNIEWDNINLETEVGKKREYAFKEGSIPVNCWCLKADFAESSSSHNTGTSRFWNEVLRNAGLITKAQIKAAKYTEEYPYDIRTAIDGFPIVVFYQPLDGSAPRFEGKYNFNNDKSTESVFGFTGGIEIEDQEVVYYYIGTEKPKVHGDACEIISGGYTENPTTDSPLYVSKIKEDGTEEWYMLRGKELLDNPKMECWELLNSVNEIALFKTMKGFGLGEDDEKVGIVDGENFDGAFESRYPDCGDYFHTNSLKRFGEWLVSCRYLEVDSETGLSIPFHASALPIENYHKNSDGKLSICSLTKQKGTFEFDFPGKNFYTEIDYNSIASNITKEGYQQVNISSDVINTIIYKEVEVIPTVKDEEYEYLKLGELYYTWMPSNVLTVNELPSIHETSYDYVLVGEKYYIWANKYNFEDYHETQWVEDSAFNRALKFAVEKFDHIDMDKMAAYYIYLMRFGGVDQTVKNSMLTTEGPADDNPNSTLPSLWYFINYDNDTILGVKNDGRLVFDPYITRETKDGTGYVYAGRESTLWNNLEADAQFMQKVTEIDNKLADTGSDPSFTLSYSNALREYDINQSDKWCERIYNKDAERKYIDTYVKGWTQKVDKDGSETHVYEDYLYDVQGSRSAHRKWWLGRRFNVFDSRFCNSNFRKQLIKFRSTNLPAGSSFTIKSGEPIFYAWGHDNAVTEMTPTAIQPNDEYTFVTKLAFNIGSYLELMGAANISTLNLRNCVGALTEINVDGCYSSSVGTKMKEILIGDNSREDLVNISNTELKFDGIANASKLEKLDVTNIKNLYKIDGLNKLLNIREVYAKGTSIANLTFADGAMIEKLELPLSIETLSLTRSSLINYENIKFENGYGKLNNLTIDNCSNLMNNPEFVFNWITSVPENQRKNLSLNLQGIDWVINSNNIGNLLNLKNVGTTALSTRNIRGHILITDKINNDIAVSLQEIFGKDCFKEGSKVYIEASTAIYINMTKTIWEGENNISCSIIPVGTSLDGELTVIAEYQELLEDGEIERGFINYTDGIISMDDSKLNNDVVYFSVKESNRNFIRLIVTVRYDDKNGSIREQNAECNINKRIYPNSVSIVTAQDSINNMNKNNMSLTYNPEEINDINLEGRGFFSVKWEIASGTEGYKGLILYNDDKEVAQIQQGQGIDALANIKVTVTRNYDNQIICVGEKTLEFKDPSTIITRMMNEPLYEILVEHGLIEETVNEETGERFGKMNKQQASEIRMTDLVVDGKSIFEGNKKLTKFTEFEWFKNSYLGKIPSDSDVEITTVKNMFKGCTSLKEITLPDNFVYADSSMFEGCTSLESIYGASEGNTDENGNPIYTSLNLIHVGDNFAYNCKKLKTCNLSYPTEYIGSNAFSKCESLEKFNIPANTKLKIEYGKSDNPFTECKNIIFTGADYENPGDVKYCVKNDSTNNNIEQENVKGALYKINDDNTLSLIHMSKNTLMTDIPTDKTVYALAYSMEYRTEKNVVVPKNIIFNGEYIFNYSEGNSIILNSKITTIETTQYGSDYLFNRCNYGNNYQFADNETLIPQGCFQYAVNMNSFILPEGIVKIGINAFYNNSGLKEITLPSTLTEIDHSAFWLCNNLNIIKFNGVTPPSIHEDDFFNVRLHNIYVKPEYYGNYKNNLMYLIRPFLCPSYLYNEGYVRIIKDGNYLISDTENIITVGGLEVIQENDYMKYISSEINTDLNIYLNGEVIGQVRDRYTTIYLGDNSSLFTGDGYNFRYGVYDENIKTEMENNGWFYDSRFEGIRSKQDLPNSSGISTECDFYIPKMKYKNVNIQWGMYSYTYYNDVYGYIKDKNNNLLLNKVNIGYNFNETIMITSDTVKFGFVRNSTIRTGIDGIIINEIGESIYSDPELPAVSMTNDEEQMVKLLKVYLIAPVEIPNNVYVTVTDNKAHTYRKYWNGETLYFVLPANEIFKVTATNFITENGKEYLLEQEFIVEDEIINLNYISKNGIELKDNILAVYDYNTDWYLNINKLTGVWSENQNLISNVTVDEILSSDANGLENTKKITEIEDGIFSQALEYKGFGENIIGYIPSYTEIELFSEKLFEINDYLLSKGKEKISLNNIWTSEAFDENNAWNSDGEIISKNTPLNYYIFGRKIRY